MCIRDRYYCSRTAIFYAEKPDFKEFKSLIQTTTESDNAIQFDRVRGPEVLLLDEQLAEGLDLCAALSYPLGAPAHSHGHGRHRFNE